MDNAEQEPTPTIRAGIGRRRLTVGRLAAATKMSEPRTQRRLKNPETLQLGEVARIAAALETTPGALLEAWIKEHEQ